MATDGHLTTTTTSSVIDAEAEIHHSRGDVNDKACRINPQLLPIKGFFFMIHTALATVQPYVVVYLKQQGLSASESGVLFGSMPFLSFLVQPLVGAAADRWLKHKAVLVTATVLTGLFHLLFLAVPPRTPAGNVLTSDARLTCFSHQVPRLSMCDDDVGDIWTPSSCLEFISDNRNGSRNGSQTSGCGMVSTPCWKTVGDLFRAVSVGASGLTTRHDCFIECEDSTLLSHSAKLSLCLLEDTHQPALPICSHAEDIIFPISFKPENISEWPTRNAAKPQKRMGDSDVQCKNYNLTSFLMNSSSDIVCRNESTYQCKMKCLLDSDSERLCRTDWHHYDVTFGVMFVVLLVSYLSQAPITSMADAAVYCILKDKRDQFGRQRLYGSLGYLVASGAVSAGVYLTNKEGQKLDYTIMFSAYCVLCQISALIAFFIRIPTDVRCGHILKNTLRLLTLPKVTCFLLVIFYFGFMLGSIVSFLFWYLLDLGAPAYMFGLTRVFCVLCEIPVFTVSGRLVKRFGPIPILCVAIVTLSIRLLVYSLLRNPWLVLLVEPLHGVTFCLMITAATTYASVVSPPGMAATTQGLVGGTLWGLGRGAGGLVTGWVFSAVGARYTYGIYAACGIAVLVSYALLHFLVFTEHAPATKETEMTFSKSGEDEPTDREVQRPLVEDQHDETPVVRLDNSTGDYIRGHPSDKTEVSKRTADLKNALKFEPF
ncbi:hypothetical protein BaRGS_00025840 [Batillaria attramentaria]|uniref:Major facilitator superfamily associated domain-containing protein n=1 Tax=Batillaria attramentaria TaxID=370345 RepID=A0ABD0K7N5_9CAEN